jgi:hypothetical protein
MIELGAGGVAQIGDLLGDRRGRTAQNDVAGERVISGAVADRLLLDGAEGAGEDVGLGWTCGAVRILRARCLFQ